MKIMFEQCCGHRNLVPTTFLWAQEFCAHKILVGTISWWAPRARARRVAAPVSIADVFPTVLAAIGAASEPGLHGRSLWNAVLGGEEVRLRLR